jgi:hypothetical protein
MVHDNEFYFADILWRGGCVVKKNKASVRFIEKIELFSVCPLFNEIPILQFLKC